MAKATVLVLSINGAVGGKQEKYYLKGAPSITDQATMDIAKNIVWGRTAFFGEEAFLTYARLSTTGRPPDKETVEFAYPLGPHPSWGSSTSVGDTLDSINDDNTTVHMCFQLAGSKWSNHYLNFTPDPWVSGMKLNTGVVPYFQIQPGPVPTDLSPSSNLSHRAVCQGFWAVLKDKCCSARLSPGGDAVLSDITRIIFRAVTRRIVGRPFGLHRGRRPSTLIT